MSTVLCLNVIGDRTHVYDLSSDFPKEIEGYFQRKHTTTLRISKADHIKYLARAKLAGTAVGFGHYIRATENLNRWALEDLFKSIALKGIYVDESDDITDATATAVFLNQRIKGENKCKEISIHSTPAGSCSFDTSGFY